MYISKSYLITVLLQFFYMSGAAQDTSFYQTISKELTAHKESNLASQLYLHLDKTIYVHNENIWFSAYLLRSATNVKEHHTVFVFLSRKDTKQIVLQQKFVMANGLASGYLFLPDTLSATFYDLIAYTNQLPHESPEDVFHQEIRLASSSPDLYQISYFKEDSASESSKLTFQISNLNESIPKNS